MGDFSVILWAVEFFDEVARWRTAVPGIRPPGGASNGSQARPPARLAGGRTGLGIPPPGAGGGLLVAEEKLTFGLGPGDTG